MTKYVMIGLLFEVSDAEAAGLVFDTDLRNRLIGRRTPGTDRRPAFWETAEMVDRPARLPGAGAAIGHAFAGRAAEREAVGKAAAKKGAGR
jgi:hypothetical protein